MKVYLTILTDYYDETSSVMSVIRSRKDVKDTLKKDVMDQSHIGSDDTFISLVRMDLTEEEIQRLESGEEHEEEDELLIDTIPQEDILLDDNESFLTEIIGVYCRENGLDEYDDDVIDDVRDKLCDDEDLYEGYLDKYFSTILYKIL